ncbi:MAG TPA: aminotransferase class IV, partial [Woeseiaceae bacterium]|nr:aminotransferase class IV [Woeseiaceae bacterium]
SARRSPTVLFGAFASVPQPASYYQEGVTTTICRTRLATYSPTAGLKTLNRLEQVLARSELVELDFFEGLTLDADDDVICGTMSNVFFVKEQSISTPPIDRSGVAGVMREHIVKSLAESGRDVLIQRLPRSDLGNVDEIFVSNSQFGIIPVAACGDFRWGVGKLTRQVMTTMAHAGVRECQT